MGLETELARFGEPDSYLVQTVQTLMRKRDEVCGVLREVGMTPVIPDGGYFVLADMSTIGKEFDTSPGKEAYDFQFAKWMMVEKVRYYCLSLSLTHHFLPSHLQGIASIPPSAFYGPDHTHISGKLLRFCFCKVQPKSS